MKTVVFVLSLLLATAAEASVCDNLRWDARDYMNANPFTVGPTTYTNACGESYFRTGTLFDGNWTASATESGTGLRAHIEDANPTRGQDDGAFTDCDNGTPQECGFPLPNTWNVGDNSDLNSEDTPWVHTHPAIESKVASLLSPLRFATNPFMGNSGQNQPFNYGSLNCKKAEDPVFEVTITSIGVPTGNNPPGEGFGNRWIGTTGLEFEGLDLASVRQHRQVRVKVVYGPETIFPARGINRSGESNPGQLNITAIYVDDAGTLTGERFLFEPPEIYTALDSCQETLYNIGIGSEGYMTGDSRRIAGLVVDARPDRVAYSIKDVHAYPDADGDGVANTWDADFDQNGVEEWGGFFPPSGDYFGAFVPCWNAGPSIAAGCEAMDMDADGDIDNADDAVVKNRISNFGTPGF